MKGSTMKRLLLTLALLIPAPALATNTVVVVLDDFRYDDVARVPALQELAASGTSYVNAAPAYTLCTPSRVSILTGLLPKNHGVRSNDPTDFDQSRTYAPWLQAAGVHTGLIGKYVNKMSKLPSTPPGWDTYEPLPKMSTYGTAQTDVLAAQLKGFIEEAPEPFHLYFAPVAPHGPLNGPDWCAPKTFPEMPKPISYVEMPGIEKRWRQRISSLCGLDFLIDQLVALLNDRGVLDDTTIIVTSDQGFLLGEHGENGKLALYEEVVHVPFIVVGAGFPAGSVNTRVVSLVDIAPTIARLHGVTAPAGLDGRDIVASKRRMFAPLDDDNCTGKRRPHEKIMSCDGGPKVRYDLIADPYEMRPF